MPRWTPEARLKQAAAIRRWTPWTLSTGPVTAKGKARSCRNAWKGGLRAKITNWHKALRQIGLVTERLYSSVCPKRCIRRTAATAPGPDFLSRALGWDADDEGDDELDAVDRMSSAQLQAAFQRMMAGQRGLVAA